MSRTWRKIPALLRTKHGRRRLRRGALARSDRLIRPPRVRVPSYGDPPSPDCRRCRHVREDDDDASDRRRPGVPRRTIRRLERRCLRLQGAPADPAVAPRRRDRGRNSPVRRDGPVRPPDSPRHRGRHIHRQRARQIARLPRAHAGGEGDDGSSAFVRRPCRSERR